MDRKIKKYLEDIMLAIGEIELFLSQRPKQYQVFLDDHMFRSALERQRRNYWRSYVKNFVLRT